MLSFSPVWLQQPGGIGTFTEGENVSVALSATERSVAMAPAGTTLLQIGPGIHERIVLVLVGNLSVPFAASEGQILVPALGMAMPVTVELVPSLTFSIINGALPPGLSLSETGVVSGVVANIPASEPLDYSFTVRIDNGRDVRDRAFTITAVPVATPTVVETENLPDLVVDDELGISYRPLGTFDRLDPFTFRLDISDDDGVIPPTRLRPVTGLPNRGDVFGGLPHGLVFSGQAINGVVAASTIAGRYFFRLEVLDEPPISKTFMIEITNTVDARVRSRRTASWVTPSGSLGTLIEGDASYLEVRAVATDPIVYTLSPTSAPMPPGLTLDPSTGAIKGIAPHLAADTTFSFVVRASADQGTFIERLFTITVRRRFNTSPTRTLSFRPNAITQRAYRTSYGNIIPRDALYRPDDPNFGLRPPEVTLLSGLSPTGNISEAMFDNGERDYWGRVRLVLGDHRVAFARDAQGNVVYEVVVRPVFDPISRAGGFSRNSNVPVEERIIYPQSGTTPTFIFPNSLRNMRFDLVRDIGFAVSDPERARTIGLSGPEWLPLWMRSEQRPGDPASRPGYFPCVPICFVKPGRSREVIEALIRNESALPRTGTPLVFDRLSVATDFDTGYEILLENGHELFGVIGRARLTRTIAPFTAIASARSTTFAGSVATVPDVIAAMTGRNRVVGGLSTNVPAFISASQAGTETIATLSASIPVFETISVAMALGQASAENDVAAFAFDGQGDSLVLGQSDLTIAPFTTAVASVPEFTQSASGIATDYADYVDQGFVAFADFRQGVYALPGRGAERIPQPNIVGTINGTIGSGGSLPTGWTMAGAPGLTVEVIGTGLFRDGSPFVSIRINGSTDQNWRIRASASNAIPIDAGRPYLGRSQHRVHAGTATGATTQHGFVWATPQGTFISGSLTPYTPNSVDQVISTLAASPLTAGLCHYEWFFTGANQVYTDYVIRIGSPSITEVLDTPRFVSEAEWLSRFVSTASSQRLRQIPAAFGHDLLNGQGQFVGSTDWSSTVENTWSIANGKATITNAIGTLRNTFAPSNSLLTTIPGRTYAVEFTISDYVSGTIRPFFDGGGAGSTTVGPLRSGNGTYRNVFVASNFDQRFNIGIDGGVNATLSISNVRIVEVVERFGNADKLVPTGADRARIDYSRAGRRVLFEHALTNKCTARKHNPISTAEMTLWGDGATLTLVDDMENLVASGLDLICTNGLVYCIDNTAGTDRASVTINGMVGNVNTHSVSAYIRGGNGFISLGSTVTGAPIAGQGGFPSSPLYEYRTLNERVPDNSGRVFRIAAEVGQVVYFILPGLYESTLAPIHPIAGDTLTATTRSMETMRLPLEAEYYVGLTAGAILVRGSGVDRTPNGRIVGINGTNALIERSGNGVRMTNTSTLLAQPGNGDTSLFGAVAFWDGTGRGIAVNEGAVALDANGPGTRTEVYIARSGTVTQNTYADGHYDFVGILPFRTPSQFAEALAKHYDLARTELKLVKPVSSPDNLAVSDTIIGE